MTKGGGDKEVNQNIEEDVADPEHADSTADEGGIDLSDFVTLELTLEEARRQYDDEERRRDTVENKIGIVVTVNALLISFAAIYSQGPANGLGLHPLVLVIVLLPALVSAGLGLYAIRSRDYERPGKPILDLHEYRNYDSIEEQQEQLLLDYEKATAENKEKNDPKFKIFNTCILLTFISIFLLLTVPLLVHFGISAWIVDLVENGIDVVLN